MPEEYSIKDYKWIRELMKYPQILAERLNFFEDTSQITVPEDPIDRVIF